MSNEELRSPTTGDVETDFPVLSAKPAEVLEPGYRASHAYEEEVLQSLGEQSVGAMKISYIESRPEKERLPESVLKILMDRKERGYRRGIDNDGRKVGLTFDPGAYSGVVSLAMARKLQAAGLLECVDAFYGLSAGGVNAAYAAMGQLKEGMDTYVNLMPDNGLLQFPSLFPPKSLKMDLDVLRQAVYEQHPLKIKELIDSKIPVVVGVSDLSNPDNPAKMFKSTEADSRNPNEFIEQMIMGCNLPFIAGSPIQDSEGHKYTDATMAWSSPVELAIRDGCTEVLSLANFAPPPQEIKTLKSKLATIVTGQVGNRYLEHHMSEEYKEDAKRQKTLWQITHPFKALQDALFDDVPYYPMYSEALARKDKIEHTYSESIFVEKGFGRVPAVAVERIYPPDLPGLPEILTADKRRLRVGIKAGRLAIRKALKSAQLNTDEAVAA